MKYNCVQCGKCCRNLNANGEFGLFLLPDEVLNFPSSRIIPCLGKGKTPNHSSFKIMAYQLIDKICPHLQGKLCGIYEKRPLACKKYPYKIDNYIGKKTLVSINPGCTSHENAIKSGTFIEGRPSQDFDEIDYAKKAGVWTLKFRAQHKRKDTPWIYNMKTKKWGPYK